MNAFDFADYVKEVNTSRRVRKAKALVYQVEADDIHVVSACNPTVTIAGESAATPMVEYLPRLAGLLAAFQRGLPPGDALRFGCAAAGASVMRPGTLLCRMEDVSALLPALSADALP